MLEKSDIDKVSPFVYSERYCYDSVSSYVVVIVATLYQLRIFLKYLASLNTIFPLMDCIFLLLKKAEHQHMLANL